MAHSHGYVQVPPNSTGVKVATTERSILHFDNIVGSFVKGDLVTGATSGATGEVTSVTLSTDGLSGLLYLSSQEGSFINDENLQVASVTQAISDITMFPNDTVAHQKSVICDPDNPDHIQKVDRYGATVNTFSDGAPNFGAFGTLTVGQPTIVKNYNFEYNNLSSDFWDQTVGAGTTSFEVSSGNCLVSTSTASGDKISRTSHYYHHYFPTVGTEVWQTMQMGDNGKANLRRRWGYFDDNNGLFWELDGTTLYAVIRSDVSGSIVERKVASSDFSDNTLNNADKEDFTLDLTTPNIFVIDFQYLGAGRVRFNVIDQRGQKVVAHVFENVSNPVASYPYIRSGSMPMRFEQENTGTVVSTSEWRINCCSVRYTQNIIPSGTLLSHGLSGLKTITPGDGETLIAAYRPGTTFNGQTNRLIVKLVRLTMNNVINTGGGPVIFRARVYPSSTAFTDSTFTQVSPIGATEVATNGTVWPAASLIQGTYLLTGNESKDVNMMENTTRQAFKNELFLNADGTTQPVMFVTAQCLSGTNADVYFSSSYEEIE